MSGRALRRTFVAEGAVAIEADLRLRRRSGSRGTLAAGDGEERRRGGRGCRCAAPTHTLRIERPEGVRARRHGASAAIATTYWVAIDGRTWRLEMAVTAACGTRRTMTGLQDAATAVSPMTGLSSRRSRVAAGGGRGARRAELFIVEAMKMEYVVRAPRDVVVDAEVGFEAGGQVDRGPVVVSPSQEDA